MVFYRKYRPQKIDELDSKQVRESLTAVLTQSDPPHAFLFTGPKGLGKTSTARIVAKAINCEKVSRVAQVPQVPRGKSQEKARDTRGTRDTLGTSQIEPCNECSQCVSITNGSNVDIIEIDGASNRNIDDVRDLKEKITLSPAAARRKIYIIDEVHMFTTESFNALLKTLEEPPAHAMFILCTTERHKVPATIVSRCFTIDFQLATKDELIRSFKRIADGEGLQIGDDVYETIVELADGGFRDGAKVLEELAGTANDKVITKDLVEARYKLSTINNQLSTFLRALQKKDAKEGLQIIQNLVSEGVDIRQFLLKLLEVVHEAMLIDAGVENKFKVQSAKFKVSKEELRALVILLSKAYGEMKFAILPQLPLELAVMEWASLKNADQNAEERREEVQRDSAFNSASISADPKAVSISSMRKQVGDLARVKALYGEPKVVKADSAARDSVPAVNLMQVSNSEITPEWLAHFWATFIAETKNHNHTLAGVLRGCTIKSFDNKLLLIEAGYKFHKDRLDEAKTRAVLEEVCKILTGNTVTVQVELKK